LSADKKTAITDEEKRLLIHEIIDTCQKMMEKIITEKSPKKRARKWSQTHSQSKMSITRDSILFNLLTDEQPLPARPRDFRLLLTEEEKNIKRWDLTEILTSYVRMNLLNPKRDDFPFPKGRPKSDSRISEERRGGPSYYEPSKIKEVIDEILKDPQAIKEINNALIGIEIFYKFIKYSFETALYQIKENEDAFLNSYKPAIQKYGLAYKNKEEQNESWIYARDLTENKIKDLSEKYAHSTIAQFKNEGKNIIYYTIAGLLYFRNAYDSKDNMPTS
jgi:hypothetical protein